MIPDVNDPGRTGSAEFVIRNPEDTRLTAAFTAVNDCNYHIIVAVGRALTRYLKGCSNEKEAQLIEAYHLCPLTPSTGQGDRHLAGHFSMLKGSTGGWVELQGSTMSLHAVHSTFAQFLDGESLSWALRTITAILYLGNIHFGSTLDDQSQELKHAIQLLTDDETLVKQVKTSLYDASVSVTKDLRDAKSQYVPRKSQIARDALCQGLYANVKEVGSWIRFG